MNKTRFCKIRNLFEVILLMCLSLQIRGAQAQTARFTIHLEKVPMEQVVNEIEKQSRYLFLFNKDIDSRRIIVSVNAENQTITQILPALFKDTGLDYTIEGMSILVTKKADASEKPVQVRGKKCLTSKDSRLWGLQSSFRERPWVSLPMLKAVSNWKSRPRRHPGCLRSATWDTRPPV